MSDARQDQTFVESLVRRAGARARVQRLADRLREVPSQWGDLEQPPGVELDRFERHFISAAYARILGTPEKMVVRRQDRILRAMVTRILFPLEAYEDRLLVFLEERGPEALFHHVVREFSLESSPEPVMQAADTCRHAVFALEDALRHPDAERKPEGIVEAHLKQHQVIRSAADLSRIPYGITGLALLRVTAMTDLGGLPDDKDTTNQY